MQKILESIIDQAPTFVVSCVASLLLVALTPWLFAIMNRANDEGAVQSAHSRPTLRLGGIACVLGMLFGCLYSNLWSSTSFLLLCTALPLFFFGLLEDIGHHMTPRIRMAAIAMSTLAAVFVFGIELNRLGIPGIDMLLGVAPIAILFTVFAVTGAVNAFNLIDGVNGLASYTAVSVSLSLSVLAWQFGHGDLLHLSSLILAATFGFFIVNYPFGRLFLGDAGAYLLGFVLIGTGLILYERQPDVSAFSILLIFFWPVADTCLAIWRRVKLSTPHDRPDRLHFHQLVMRFIEIRVLGRGSRGRSNPLTTLFLIPFISIPQITGVLLATHHVASVIAVLFFGAAFFGSYALGMQIAKRGHVRHFSKQNEMPSNSVAAE